MRWNKRADLVAGGYWRCGELYKDTQKAWADAHREQRAAYMAKWRADNQRDRRAYMRRYRYGIDAETYDALYARQNGRCELCDVPAENAPKGALHVDHDHATGRVRGLLCVQCNAALERLERIGWTNRATAYLAA